ncbi:uncharacterized protein GJ701_008490 [Geothlypis trichas]
MLRPPALSSAPARAEILQRRQCQECLGESFSAEKDHRMWLGDALDRISSRLCHIFGTLPREKKTNPAVLHETKVPCMPIPLPETWSSSSVCDSPGADLHHGAYRWARVKQPDLAQGAGGRGSEQRACTAQPAQLEQPTRRSVSRRNSWRMHHPGKVNRAKQRLPSPGLHS